MAAQKLTFAIDYDDTFTACSELWANFILDAEAKGHRVIVVTARRDTDKNLLLIRETLASWGITLPIVFSSLGSKLDAVRRREIKVDIWIDDDPEKLVNGH